MHHIWLIAVVGSAGMVAIASFVAFQHRPARLVVARVSEPRLLVEMLTTQAALADAVRRAASFERGVAARANGRADRYEALVVLEVVQDVEATVHDIGERSAS